VGLSDLAINAAWPTWWSDAADASSSAQAELRFSLARKLGMDPHSLLEDASEPRFVWRDEARFKHATAEGEQERAGITSFGVALGGVLLSATAGVVASPDLDARRLRDAILGTQPYVRLLDLVAICWGVGIPVVHLRVFPFPQKRMAAMSVRVAGRSAILLGKDAMYPPHIAFYLAHELGHVALGHVDKQPVIIDFGIQDALPSADDPEEISADEFALELLTGEPQPKVLPTGAAVTAPALAKATLDASQDLGIEPGTLALCFGYSTQNWAVANAAMRWIYSSASPVWEEVNKIALGQLDLDRVPDDVQPFLLAVLGQAQPA